VKHECGGQHELGLRLELALLTNDPSAIPNIELIDAELGGCGRCWRSVALWAVQLLAGRDATNAGSASAAADSVAREIKRILMPPE
jgi:hypothetical protein